jgi:ribosomal protein S18 acetylase RimI-like enzyme
MVKASFADLPAVLELFDRELGRSIYSRADLEADLADPEVVFLVERGIAAALGRLLIPEDLAYYERFGELAQRAFAAGQVGSIEALAVAPSERRRGLGRALVETAAEWLFNAGASAIVVVGWDSGRPDSSLPLLRSLRFEESVRVERFYEEESRHDGWICPVDGNPCRCSAVLFVRWARGDDAPTPDRRRI